MASAQGTAMRARLIGTTSNPTVIVSAPGDATRLFVGSNRGPIRILKLPDEQFLDQPFLTVPNAGGANGVLWMAFHPDFATNGRFYISTQETTGKVRLITGVVSATDPNVADASSITTVLFIDDQASQHTGGWIGFDSHGYLLMVTGDQMGPGTAPSQNAANYAGKMLRLDVDGLDNIPGNTDDDQFPDDANRNYSIPPSNPLVGNTDGYLEEIWALGLRNPYRCSRDVTTGNVWIGDVGNFQREEIDRLEPDVPAVNFGWPVCEGTIIPTSPYPPCENPAFRMPMFDYLRTGEEPSGNTVIGGVVYRGCAMPEFHGLFLFADFTNDWIGMLRPGDTLDGVGTAAARASLVSLRSSANLGLATNTINGTSVFGQDARGEVYFARYISGQIYKLEPAASGGGLGRDCDGDGVVDSCATGVMPCRADVTGDCAVTIDDLTEYLESFLTGLLAADQSDAEDSGVVDGAVTIDDLLFFLGRFAAGC
ncbi:MAG: PQQ-dependent sugar dehydrogenase [Phycisphaerales bacterium]